MNIVFNGFHCKIQLQEYRNGGKCIRLVGSTDEMPVATATSWIPGLHPGEVAIKDYSENEGMLRTLVDHGTVHPPHRELNGFPICRLTSAMLPPCQKGEGCYAESFTTATLASGDFELLPQCSPCARRLA